MISIYNDQKIVDNKNRIYDNSKVADDQKTVDNKNRVYDNNKNKVYDNNKNRAYYYNKNRIYDNSKVVNDQKVADNKNRVYDNNKNKVYYYNKNRIYDNSKVVDYKKILKRKRNRQNYFNRLKLLVFNTKDLLRTSYFDRRSILSRRILRLKYGKSFWLHNKYDSKFNIKQIYLNKFRSYYSMIYLLANNKIWLERAHRILNLKLKLSCSKLNRLCWKLLHLIFNLMSKNLFKSPSKGLISNSELNSIILSSKCSHIFYKIIACKLKFAILKFDFNLLIRKYKLFIHEFSVLIYNIKSCKFNIIIRKNTIKSPIVTNKFKVLFGYGKVPQEVVVKKFNYKIPDVLSKPTKLINQLYIDIFEYCCDPVSTNDFKKIINIEDWGIIINKWKEISRIKSSKYVFSYIPKSKFILRQRGVYARVYRKKNKKDMRIRKALIKFNSLSKKEQRIEKKRRKLFIRLLKYKNKQIRKRRNHGVNLCRRLMWRKTLCYYNKLYSILGRSRKRGIRKIYRMKKYFKRKYFKFSRLYAFILRGRAARAFRFNKRFRTYNYNLAKFKDKFVFNNVVKRWMARKWEMSPKTLSLRNTMRTHNLRYSPKAYKFMAFQQWYNTWSTRVYYSNVRYHNDPISMSGPFYSHMVNRKVNVYDTRIEDTGWSDEIGGLTKSWRHKMWGNFNPKYLKILSRWMVNYDVLRPKIKKLISFSNSVPKDITLADLYADPSKLKLRFLPKLYTYKFGKIYGDGAIGKIYTYYYYNNLVKTNNHYWPFIFQKLNLRLSNRLLSTKKRWRLLKRARIPNNKYYLKAHYKLYLKFILSYSNIWYSKIKIIKSEVNKFNLWLYKKKIYLLFRYYKFRINWIKLMITMKRCTKYLLERIYNNLNVFIISNYKFNITNLYKRINFNNFKLFVSSSDLFNFNSSIRNIYLNKYYHSNEFFNKCINKLYINRRLNYIFIKNGKYIQRLDYTNNSVFNSWSTLKNFKRKVYIKYLRRYNFNRFLGRWRYYDYKLLNNIIFWSIYCLFSVTIQRSYFISQLWLIRFGEHNLLDSIKLNGNVTQIKRLLNCHFSLKLDRWGGRINPWWGFHMRPYIKIKYIYGLNYNYIIAIR